MNQEKIGKFILELRKEKKMTQQELALKIGVTDRAISKWENGRGMPDLSLMKPLCDELGISINELISGEKINKKEYHDRFEENIFNTINYSQKQIKRLEINM
jgi:transcriptional regulator with XRE-family HTH domain